MEISLSEVISIVESHCRDVDEDGKCPCSICGTPAAESHDKTCPIAVLKGLGEGGLQPHLPIPVYDFAVHVFLFAKNHYKTEFEATGLPPIECLRLILAHYSATNYQFMRYPSDEQVLKLVNLAFNRHVPQIARMDAVDRVSDVAGRHEPAPLKGNVRAALVEVMCGAISVVEVADAPFDVGTKRVEVPRAAIDDAVMKWAEMCGKDAGPAAKPAGGGFNKDKRIKLEVRSQPTVTLSF